MSTRSSANPDLDGRFVPRLASGSPLRLLAAISDLGGGGAERQFQLLVRGLSRRDFDLEAMLWRQKFDYELPVDVPIHVVPKSRTWHGPRAILQTKRLIERRRPDVIFSQLHFVNMVVGTAIFASRHKPRWICRFSSDPREEMKGPFALWARWALRRADRIVACSHGVRGALCEHLDLDGKRVFVVPNLLDIARVRSLAVRDPVPRHEGQFVVLHVGRLEAEKNQAALLDAFARIASPATRLWMVGKGSLLPQLQARSRDLGIEHLVDWFGFQDNPYRFMKAADCLVLSSHYEGFPNVLLEAMACGTAVVSTRCRYGPDEIIDHMRTGVLVQEGDSRALAEGMRQLQTSRGLRESLVRAATQVLESRFDFRQGIDNYERHFLEMVK